MGPAPKTANGDQAGCFMPKDQGKAGAMGKTNALRVTFDPHLCNLIRNIRHLCFKRPERQTGDRGAIALLDG
jgi:hypothetical protein